MRAGGIFNPKFFYHPRPTLGTTQLVKVSIFEMNPNAGDWTPEVGIDPNYDTLVWTGHARVQPNKDWRARPREVQYEYDAVQAVRVQISIGKNLLGAVWDPDQERYTSYGPDPEFIKDMRVHIDEGPVTGFEGMEGDNLYIRNAIQNQNLWVYNLLCDTKTGGVADI